MKLTQSERMKKRWQTPEYREMMIMGAKKRGQDPEFKKKMSKIYQSPEYQEKRSKISKEQWEDPEHREMMFKVYQNPELREKRAKLTREQWKDPEHRKKMREWWADPEFREKMSGENSPQWRGGISKHPYPFAFNDDLKQKIKERDGYKCVLCESEGVLPIHHINYDKTDLREENLITLCVSCHIKTNHNRDYWEAFLVDLQGKRKCDDYVVIPYNGYGTTFTGPHVFT